MITVDARYVVLVLVMVGSLYVIKRRPQWTTPATIALASTALTYSILFLR